DFLHALLEEVGLYADAGVVIRYLLDVARRDGTPPHGLIHLGDVRRGELSLILIGRRVPGSIREYHAPTSHEVLPRQVVQKTDAGSASGNHAAADDRKCEVR